MNRNKLYMKLYRLIFMSGRVFSQSDGQVFLNGLFFNVHKFTFLCILVS